MKSNFINLLNSMEIVRNIMLVFITLMLVSFSTGDEDFIYGTYTNNSGGIHSVETLMLNLSKDKSYSLTFSECDFKQDSGIYHIFNDTIFLNPSIRYDNVLSCVNSGLKNISNKILIDKGQLKILGLNDSKANFLLTKQGQVSQIKNLLNEKGNGYLRLIDSNNYTLEEGYYEDYKLYNGVKYIYDVNPKDIDINKAEIGVDNYYYMSISKIEIKNGEEQQ